MANVKRLSSFTDITLTVKSLKNFRVKYYTVNRGGVGVGWGWVGYLWSNYECFPIGGCKDIDF